MLRKFNFRSNGGSCLPVRLSAYKDLIKTEKKMCETWDEENQSFEVFLARYNADLMNACNSSCTQHNYIGYTTSSKKSRKISNEIQIGFNFPYNEIQVFEEYLMFSVNDLIGTIGGHSGLFIGFSFHGFITMIFEYLQRQLLNFNI